MRRGLGEYLLRLIHHSEKKIIRMMVFACLALTVTQCWRARDPLQFYLAFAQKIEETAMDVRSQPVPAMSAEQAARPLPESWAVVLKAQPAAAVKVSQNGELLGTLSQGELTLKVQAGKIQLDGREIRELIRVQVVRTAAPLSQPQVNQVYLLQGNVQEIPVTP